jgi:hypothetical protein
MNFRAGDLFRVKSNGATGQIVDVIWNKINRQDEYVVVWDDMAISQQYYSIADGDTNWEPHLPALFGGVSPVWIPSYASPLFGGMDFNDIKVSVTTCMLGHDWVKYQGLSEVFEYCKICDKKKE